MRKKKKAENCSVLPVSTASAPSVGCACVCRNGWVWHVKASEWITLCVQVRFFSLGAIKGSLPRGSSAREVLGCSVLHIAMLLASLFNLYFGPLGNIVGHHSMLSSVPGWHPAQYLFCTQPEKRLSPGHLRVYQQSVLGRNELAYTSLRMYPGASGKLRDAGGSFKELSI